MAQNQKKAQLMAIEKRWLFLGSVVTGLAISLGFGAYVHSSEQHSITVHQLTQEIAVTEQLQPDNMGHLKDEGFVTVIDLRPDGEVVDQPSSVEMAEAARSSGLQFYYVPVPHGAIPDQAVNQLADALRKAPKPVILYCRSGKRAARTWSLVEASRPDGLEGDAILAAVKNAGQTAVDLQPDIKMRIAHRTAPTGQQP